MGDSENDVVLKNTGPSVDNNAAYGNFEVGSRFLQVSEHETSEFVKKKEQKQKYPKKNWRERKNSLQLVNRSLCKS